MIPEFAVFHLIPMGMENLLEIVFFAASPGNVIPKIFGQLLTPPDAASPYEKYQYGT